MTYEERLDKIRASILKDYTRMFEKVIKGPYDSSDPCFLIPSKVRNLDLESMATMCDRIKSVYDNIRSKEEVCGTCRHLRDHKEAVRLGRPCDSLWQVCDHYVNPNAKVKRKQVTYVRRPTNKACPNYEYDNNNFINRKRCQKEKSIQ